MHLMAQEMLLHGKEKWTYLFWVQKGLEELDTECHYLKQCSRQFILCIYSVFVLVQEISYFRLEMSLKSISK